ncbi:uncharacterized protein LOC135530588 [Oncorhynchus masou masou]|uniref:uncharacterized protein LOC135530588 n=1 Tax=Oncorhynchus masou masou TaxID=90313 RepID=UPI0031837C82
MPRICSRSTKGDLDGPLSVALGVKGPTGILQIIITSHHKRTRQRGEKQQCFLEEWTWEEILEGKGPWAGEHRRPKEELEASKAERRHYEELAQRTKHKRQPKNIFWRWWHTGRVAESGYRPEPTPRAYRKERGTGRAPHLAVKRTVSPVRSHSPVRYMPALCKCDARVGIQPGQIVAAQRAWSPVRRFGTGNPAPALPTVSPVRCDSPVRPMPALRPCQAKVGIQPRGEVQVESSRSPVLPHSPVRPLPALWRCRPKVGIQPGRVVPGIRTRSPVLHHSLVFQYLLHGPVLLCLSPAC